MKKAIVAGGCFWCTEAVFKSLKGVIDAVPGYIGGAKANPTYEEVCTGETGHAEAIEITYNEHEISYTELLEIFFATHNPTTLNRQGEDVGTQYRSEIFYVDEGQKQAALEYIGILNDEKVFDQPIVTQVSPASTFYVAEEYHKNYFERKGTENPYCQMVVKPKVEKFKKNYTSKLK
ncbi:peptide-methionine (S)-S-oxide reductase [Myroides gitamensis]|uniref:peptide-methionine (S)-S-oxide reductase MsrA n=1 Tax=Myroides odoratus TaxID=256 RepID=UPI002168350C|nr:peptide-methionine (S)-S-oxide reductase MsrA [Myroides odoratus]MCS4238084.1 peptide-methionine (S)-S-oxide reductase [Myroides odoratus]MDH6600161.1 peptide-methionine (S)-S-oxide reductase [Myroides gitamensis]